jgi:transcriptional regulator with GAF, ATPase, and Fis domain
LIKVNCGAIPAGLVESELFGHVKGAFTGALQNRTGRFELAHGGTLFLDEVAELPLDTQVKLLRVLQEGEFEPVGSDRTARVDVRVIAASNRRLDELVKAGKFRADLLYRLNVFPLEVPALRERKGDIPLLVSFFVSRFSLRLGKRLDGLSADGMEMLMRYSWPGNVRELQNVIERAAILARAPLIDVEGELEPGDGAAAPGSLESVERAHILETLEKAGWVIEGPRGAAASLGLHPNTLRGRMKKLGIARPPRS